MRAMMTSENSIVSFIVPGKPVGKQRPAGQSHRYAGPKSAEWERYVALLARRAKKSDLVTPQAVGITIDIRVSIPKSWKARERANALAGHVYPVITPDTSNVLKSVEDALNKICYQDDRQISMTVITRKYALRDETSIGVFLPATEGGMMDGAIEEFGDPVTLITRAGYRNDHGEWVDGVTTRTDTVASVEPVMADAIDQLPSGARLDDWRCFYVSGDAPALSVGGVGEADVIIYNSQSYRVSVVEEWGEYRKILAVRITP